MCGIAGLWGEVNTIAVQKMIEIQRHRGPDGHGIAPNKHGVLGHTRLAIMDPEQGSQPMVNHDRSLTLVANGMIYNHPDLRRFLLDGHDFVTQSDSETILHVFEDHDLATPELLDGMFAFAVYRNGQLVLARDRIGIKPLYYARQIAADGSSNLYFASELKALTNLADDVKEFPPGTVYHSQSGFHAYYEVPHSQPLERELFEHIRIVRETIELAVRKRLLSDVPLGAFLSGGLDSSIIAAVAKKYMPQLHTFAVGAEGSRDLQAARRVARHIGSSHHEYQYTAGEVEKNLPEILYHLESFDQDLVRSAMPTWFCARLVSEHVKVILTGEGADELFAGYKYHKRITDEQALHHELRDSISRLHNINLQRVDRMTMRHGVEARVPFLDTDVIAMAQTIPPHLKLFTDPNGYRIEKWILRKAFEDMLPAEIVWREKEQFDEGSGMVAMVPQVLAKMAEGMDSAQYRAKYASDRLRSGEECFYHHMLMQQFDKPAAVLANVGRWQFEQQGSGA